MGKQKKRKRLCFLQSDVNLIERNIKCETAHISFYKVNCLEKLSIKINGRERPPIFSLGNLILYKRSRS